MGSGAATFSSSVTATQFNSTGGRGTSFGYKLPDWQIYNTTSGNALAFSNYSSDLLYITSGGNVGIGTTSPSEQLSLMGANAYTSKIRFSYGASATSYYANFGYNSDGNKVYLQIADGSSAANIMTWNYNGNVGIGTTSPAALFHVAKGSSGEVARFSAPNAYIPYIIIGRPDVATEGMKLGYDSTTGDTSFETIASHNMLFKNNNTERMRITSGGSVGIGTSSPLTKLQVDSTTDDGLYLSSFKTNTGNANTGASLFFGFNDGANNRDAANIKGLKENGTSGDYASYMSFATRANGGSVTERMRITSGGLVGIGTTSPGRNLSIESSDIWVSLKRTSNREYLIGQGVSDSFRILDATAGVDRFAIKSTGIVNISNVPTSSAGLSSGDIYKDGSGFLKIV